MKKKVGIILITLLVLFYIVPLFVHLGVSVTSPFGFISNEKQDIWINFYAALIGGVLTLIGVGWTIRYTDATRKEDQRKHEQEQKDEFEKRNLETKINLSAQFKPILTISFDSNQIVDVKYGVSKYDGFYIKNIISLNDKVQFQSNEKRISFSLYVLNIGRGEANNLRIKSLIICPNGSEWKTEIREYKEIYSSNGLNLVFCKVLTQDEWMLYDNIILDEPMKIYIKIDYEDLVGFQHTLECLVSIQRFVHMRDEEGQIIESVLVLNPYDTIIQNVTSVVEEERN